MTRKNSYRSPGGALLDATARSSALEERCEAGAETLEVMVRSTAESGESIEVDDGGDHEKRVDSVEHAAVAGQKPAGILDPGRAFEQGLRQVARLTQKAAQHAEDDGIDHRKNGGVPKRRQKPAANRTKDRAKQAGARLLRTDCGVERRLTEEA